MSYVSWVTVEIIETNLCLLILFRKLYQLLSSPNTFKQAEKLKSREMKEG